MESHKPVKRVGGYSGRNLVKDSQYLKNNLEAIFYLWGVLARNILQFQHPWRESSAWMGLFDSYVDTVQLHLPTIFCYHDYV
jgi:hypothetical protein